MGNTFLRKRAPLIATIVFTTVASSSSAAVQSNVDCRAREAQMMQRMQALMNRPDLGLCQTAREGERIYRDMASFYASCPIVDPSGANRQNAASNAAQMRQMGEQACAGGY